MKRIQIRGVKWTLGLDRETPGYTVREETKREKLIKEEETNGKQKRASNHGPI